uniref:Uncharacterized protein n=1 Tax=Glycine max TaxID=3847 RepID=C6TER8_SOYBN|nr:unknown [Glycine max]
MPVSELIVEHSHCPKHDLLQRHSRRELVGVGDRETGAAVVEDVGRGAAEAGEERKVVVVENSAVVVVLWDAVVQRKVCSVGLGECHLSVQSRIGDHAGHRSGCGVGASQNVVHEKRERVVLVSNMGFCSIVSFFCFWSFYFIQDSS